MFLSPQDRALFFKLYFDLLYCFNKRHKISACFANERYPKQNTINIMAAYEVRSELFCKPNWII